MENKIMTTAEEFIQNFIIKNHKPHSLNDRGNAGSNTEMLMIEFAKLHVEAALKAASETKILGYHGDGVYNRGDADKDSILNSYPLENIK